MYKYCTINQMIGLRLKISSNQYSKTLNWNPTTLLALPYKSERTNKPISHHTRSKRLAMRRRSRYQDKPSFFKILNLDYPRILRLPPVFTKKYESVLPDVVKLRISCGKTWEVALEEIGNGQQYCFTRGWDKFAKDLNLEMGEFLVFRMSALSVFRVSVYSLTGCRREISDSEQEDDQTFKRSRRGNAPKLEDKGPLYFEFCLKKYHQSRLTLPRKFAVATGLEKRGRECVTLEYVPGHRQELVFLDHREKWRADLTGGWGKFRRDNGIVVGQMYSFEYKPAKNVIKVRKVAIEDN